MHGSGSGPGQLGFHLGLLFEALDLRAQSGDLADHAVILVDELSGHKTVVIAMLFEEVLGLVPQGIALLAQLDDLTHVVCPPKILSYCTSA